MMQTIHPRVLTNKQIAELSDPTVTNAMIEHGSPYAKAMAIAFQSLDGDQLSQRKMLNDLSYLFTQWL
jgi:hypothetical protein